MAGHDLEVDSPQFVALEIDLHVCVAADHIRSDVQRELFDIRIIRDLPTAGAVCFIPIILRSANRFTSARSTPRRTRSPAWNRWRCAPFNASAWPMAPRWRAAGSISTGWRSRGWTTIAILPNAAS